MDVPIIERDKAEGRAVLERHTEFQMSVRYPKGYMNMELRTG